MYYHSQVNASVLLLTCQSVTIAEGSIDLSQLGGGGDPGPSLGSAPEPGCRHFIVKLG